MKLFLDKYKYAIQGLLAVIIITVFAGSVRYLAIEDNQKVISTIKKGQNEDMKARAIAEERERVANKKRDSTLLLLNASRQNETLLLNRFLGIEKSVFLLQQQYNEQYNELKNIQNEKDIIPDVSTAEQLDFISKYRYSEYK